MNNFKNYASYYNLLYKDKDYKSEVEYILNIINKYSTNKIKTILNLGCGTGKHDNIFARKGYKVTGIDLSQEMIDIANKNKLKNTHFLKGDVRNIDLNKKFDVIVSLFHVASYQTTNKDFEKYLRTAYNHLKKNDIFVFDFWYGPAVLNNKPSIRIKRLENSKFKITRISEPIMQTNKNIVEVNFEIFIKNKKTNKTKVINELHPMRYWFLPEIEFITKQVGFSIVKSFEWFSEKKLCFDSWNALIILRK